MYEQEVKYIYFGHDFVPYHAAQVHILTPAVRYGSTIFEGIRGYWNEDKQDMYVLHLSEHMARLVQSAKLMGFKIEHQVDQLCELACETIRRNGLKQDIHIRPLYYLGGTGEMHASEPTFLVIAAMPVGRLFNTENGIRCRVSSWSRISDNTMPPRIKCAANYQNSRLAMIEAKRDGYDNAIILTVAGKVSESPGACIFIVRQGQPLTPPVTGGILESITREALIRIFQDQFNIKAGVREIDRTELYAADEVFLCGSGAEIVPVLSVDGLAVGNGQVGRLTKEMQRQYFEIIRGLRDDYPEWRTAVYKT